MRRWSYWIRSVLAVLAILALAVSCGADGGGTDESADRVASENDVGDIASDDDVGLSLPASEPDDSDAPSQGDDAPIPVEPDGGIGDGAEPLPGAEEPSSDGDWHGAQVAETNCPGTEFKRIQASEFSFSLPVEFAATDEVGIDSEVGFFEADGFEVTYDFGWYSGDFASLPVDESAEIDYSGVLGEFAVVRDNAGWNSRNLVGIFFPEVGYEGGEPNRLNLVVLHDDPADEIIGRCIVGSLDWTLE